MLEALSLFNELRKKDINWIMDQGMERQVISKTVVIREGAPVTSLFFVLEGLLSVSMDTESTTSIAMLGPGSLFGEISLLLGDKASANVIAEENSLLLELDHIVITSKLDQDFAFAARFFRALACLGSQRLKQTNNRLMEVSVSKDQIDFLSHTEWDKLSSQIITYKEALIQADKLAIKNDGCVPESLAEDLIQGFHQFSAELNHILNSENEALNNELGRRCQREFLPFMVMSTIGERMYAKPRGYAGDYWTIELMYRNEATGTGRLGPVIDRAFRAQPANRAVMNRRALLFDEILKTLNPHSQTHVTSLASGPAAELFDVFSQIDDKRKLKASCIDIDLQALAFVGDQRDKLGLRNQMDLHNGNLVYLATGRQKLHLPPQDLMYSIGLIDYFNDKFVIILLNYIYEQLKPGGRVILGNFHVDNPNKALMDHILEWELIHRSEEDMHRLFLHSKFKCPCTAIHFEPERVNLFAECQKPFVD